MVLAWCGRLLSAIVLLFVTLDGSLGARLGRQDFADDEQASAQVSLDTTIAAVQEPDIRPGMIITIKGGEGNRYCTDQATHITCKSSTMGGWELFEVLDAGNGRVALIGGNQGSVCINEGDRITCTGDKVGKEESFVLEPKGSRFALLTWKDRKRCAATESGIRCNKQTDEQRATFRVKCVQNCSSAETPKLVPGNIVALRGPDDRYCSDTDLLGIKCWSHWVTPRSKFEVLDAGGGNVAFRQSGHICDDRGNYVDCQEKAVQATAMFSVHVFGTRVALQADKDKRWCSVDPKSRSFLCEQAALSRATFFSVRCVDNCSPEQARRILSGPQVDLSSKLTDSFKLTVDINTTAKSGALIGKVYKAGANRTGEKLLSLFEGKLRFQIHGIGELRGNRFVSDGEEHQVGLSWNGYWFKLLVDGREDVRGLHNVNVVDDPSMLLVLGQSQASGRAPQEFKGYIYDVTYEGMPVDLQAFAAFPGAALPLPVDQRAVDLGSAAGGFVLEVVILTYAEEGTIFAKMPKDRLPLSDDKDGFCPEPVPAQTLTNTSAGATKVLQISKGRVQFEICAVGSIVGRTRVNDGRPHQVGVSWDGDKFFLLVDGRVDAEGLAGRRVPDLPGSALFVGEPVHARTALGRAAASKALRFHGQIASASFNGSPLEL